MTRHHERHDERVLSEAFGIQHADDQFYFRPLILGQNLFSYVAHIPPGGGVPPYPVHAKRNQIEHSLYVLSGILEVEVGGASVSMVPHTAIHIAAGEAVEMLNGTDSPVSIYMVYSPSPWGPESHYEDRKAITTHDEMLAFYQARGTRIWSPEEMNAMGGDLSSKEHSLGEYKKIWESGQSPEPGKEKPWIALWEAAGIQHWHKGEREPDQFWFRPMVCGEKHLTYVGYVPPGGVVPPSAEEAQLVEECIFTLSGNLGVIIPDGEKELRFSLPPYHAIHGPQFQPEGIYNDGDQTAIFILTFTPNRPGRVSVQIFHDWAAKAEWLQFSAKELNDKFGESV